MSDSEDLYVWEDHRAPFMSGDPMICVDDDFEDLNIGGTWGCFGHNKIIKDIAKKAFEIVEASL